MAYVYNDKTGNFENDSSESSSNRTNGENEPGCFRALFRSLIIGFFSWIGLFFILIAFFGNSSNDTQEVLGIMSFVIAGVVAIVTFIKSRT